MISEPTSADGEAVESSGTANATIEPTVACENVTNEPNDPCEIVTNEPADALEPAAGFENTTIEPTADHENPTNELTAPAQNLTIEPTLAALGEDTRGVVMTAGMNDGDERTSMRSSTDKSPVSGIMPGSQGWWHYQRSSNGN